MSEQHIPASKPRYTKAFTRVEVYVALFSEQTNQKWNIERHKVGATGKDHRADCHHTIRHPIFILIYYTV